MMKFICNSSPLQKGSWIILMIFSFIVSTILPQRLQSQCDYDTNYNCEECTSTCCGSGTGTKTALILGGGALAGAAAALLVSHKHHGHSGGTGPTGPTGTTGPIGLDGLAGPIGPTGPDGAPPVIATGPAALAFSYNVVTTDIAPPALTGEIIGLLTLPDQTTLSTPPIPLTTTSTLETILVPAPAQIGSYVATFYVNSISRGTLSSFGSIIVTNSVNPGESSTFNSAGASGAFGQEVSFVYTYSPTAVP
jgi:hypothetical protein